MIIGSVMQMSPQKGRDFGQLGSFTPEGLNTRDSL